MSRGFVSYCINASYPKADCEALGKDVGASLQGNLGKRPAAVCSRLGLCSATLACNASALNSTDNSAVTGQLDMCTKTGLIGGPVVRIDGE